MESIDLRLTLMDSAQCFLWMERDGRFYASPGGVPMILGSSEPDARARHYLDMDRDYAALADEFERFPTVSAAFRACRGLHVLNQDPWDALIMFILSANNNVSRIRSITHALIQYRGTEGALPVPRVLAKCTEAELRALGTGYRAPYLIRAAAMVAEGFPLYDLRELPYETAHDMLLTLPGVGDKVADCVQLFGLGFAEAFPVDVWVERAMYTHFGLTAKSRKALAAEGRALLGPNAGIVQQMLFHAERMSLKGD